MICLLRKYLPKTISPGDSFGRWTVLESQRRGHRPAFICKCSCGTERLVLRQSLVNGASQSCGCLHRELAQNRFVTHGAHKHGKKSPEYTCWDAMLQRVRHQNQPRYKNYEGCSVDARWDPKQGGSFENFLQDMGERPGSEYSLDKDIIKPGNRHYGPGLCMWATAAEQSTATRQCRYLTLNGRTQCVTEWAREAGLKRGTLAGRLERGWSLERALSVPVSTG